VSANAIPIYVKDMDADDLIGQFFADAQGRSYVLAVDRGQEAGCIECPGGEPTPTDDADGHGADGHDADGHAAGDAHCNGSCHADGHRVADIERDLDTDRHRSGARGRRRRRPRRRDSSPAPGVTRTKPSTRSGPTGSAWRRRCASRSPQGPGEPRRSWRTRRDGRRRHRRARWPPPPPHRRRGAVRDDLIRRSESTSCPRRSRRLLDRGPGHYPSTGAPGSGRTIAIAAHRVTHTHPFLRINELRRGQRIVLTRRSHRFVYRVTAMRILTPTDVWPLRTGSKVETLVLTACHPPGTDLRRVVVFAGRVAT
jgi:LPXTG-site transpeptidase (sortase) family protein